MKTYEMNDSEFKTYKMFKERHNNLTCNGLIAVKFSPTGIGTVVEAICLTCKKREDITNYRSW